MMPLLRRIGTKRAARQAACAEAAELIIAHLSVGGVLHGSNDVQLDPDSAAYARVAAELEAIAARLWKASGRT